MSGHCLRCYCLDCDRDPAGEAHGHNCTHGFDCIERARSDTIADLRAEIERLRALVQSLSEERQYGEIKTFMGVPIEDAMRIISENRLGN